MLWHKEPVVGLGNPGAGRLVAAVALRLGLVALERIEVRELRGERDEGDLVLIRHVRARLR
jgi:hypothetical protein